MLKGVIDIGSTSVRLVLTDGVRVEKRVNTTRLAENMGDNNMLNPLSLERTAQAVAEYYFLAVQNGVDEIYAYATEAVRAAKNRFKFTDRVYELCGLSIDVLSKNSEAESGFRGAAESGRCLILDMGGASTEMTIGENGKILYSKSLPYGIVRLSAKEKSGVDMVQFILEQLHFFDDHIDFDKVIAIGGTISTMAAIEHELEEYDPNVVNGSKLSVSDIKNMFAKIKPLPYDERTKVKGLPEKRADIIAPGILMYGMLLEYLGVFELTVSEGDGAEGYLMHKGILPDGFKAKYEKIL